MEWLLFGAAVTAAGSVTAWIVIELTMLVARRLSALVCVVIAAVLTIAAWIVGGWSSIISAGIAAEAALFGMYALFLAAQRRWGVSGKFFAQAAVASLLVAVCFGQCTGLQSDGLAGMALFFSIPMALFLLLALVVISRRDAWKQKLAPRSDGT